MYEKVFIIGNGFDVDLGFNTKYANFVESDNFKELVNDGSYLAIHIEKIFSNSERLWVDIELEFISYLENRGVGIINFKDEYIKLCSALTDYLKSIDFSKIDHNSAAYSMLKENIKKGDPFIVFDFNYTPTAETILREIGIPEEDISSRLKKMHGTIKKNDIIFGIQDNVEFSQEKRFIKKSHKDNYLGHEGIEDAFKRTGREMFIFGHSLGKTDEMYFAGAFSYFTYNDIKRTAGKMSLNLYYHKEESKEILKDRIDELSNGKVSKLKINFDIKYLPTHTTVKHL